MKAYRAVANRQVLEFVAAADEDTYAEIEQWVSRIERAPFTPGDYTEQDEDRRDLQVMVLSLIAVAYWLDHSLREIRIVRIERNRGG